MQLPRCLNLTYDANRVNRDAEAEELAIQTLDINITGLVPLEVQSDVALL